MTALVIALGYAVLGVVCARWIFNRKAEEYYHRYEWVPKKCVAHGRTWAYHHEGSCRCTRKKDAVQSRERAAHWCMLGLVWPLIPVVLYLSAPSPFQRKLEKEKKDAEELEKLRAFAKKEGWEIP
ncbi:hypothetical protein ACFP2T_35880 [Plantactinospora solaniradicis]|uniref:Uncharacterized protein n=1 Tax=Plantactinospora solaniradicis TaxID=1723736 RepID=A0ABW1KIF2_9ACTN